MGAKMSGPTAKPATKRATPRLITSSDTAYSLAVMLDEEPKMLDAKAIEKMTASGAADLRSFVDRGQFWGFSGSLGPSQVTKLDGVHPGVHVLGVFVPVERPSGREIRLTAKLAGFSATLTCVAGSIVKLISWTWDAKY
jgi:hypothetical protein